MRAFMGILTGLACMALIGSGCNGHTKGSETTVTKTAKADDLPRVIVKQFSGKGLDANSVSTLADSFCAKLENFNKAQLFCPGDLGKLLKHKEMQLSFGECQEGDCLAKVGEQTQADLFILGNISKVGEVFVVQILLANGKTGEVTTRIEHQVDSGKVEDLLPAMETVAEKVVGQM